MGRRTPDLTAQSAASRIYRSRRQLRQRRFPGRTALTVPSTNTSSTCRHANRALQKTLTQLDFIHDFGIHGSDREDEAGLSIDDEDWQETRPRKRRKLRDNQSMNSKKRQSTLTQLQFFEDDLDGVLSGDEAVNEPETEEALESTHQHGVVVLAEKLRTRGRVGDLPRADEDDVEMPASRIHAPEDIYDGDADSTCDGNDFHQFLLNSDSKHAAAKHQDMKKIQRTHSRICRKATADHTNSTTAARIGSPEIPSWSLSSGPRTPRKQVKIEIPSSQSPVATVLTSQKDVLGKVLRSPLQEIPLNVVARFDVSPPPNPKRKLCIEDSQAPDDLNFEDVENEDPDDQDRIACASETTNLGTRALRQGKSCSPSTNQNLPQPRSSQASTVDVTQLTSCSSPIYARKLPRHSPSSATTDVQCSPTRPVSSSSLPLPFPFSSSPPMLLDSQIALEAAVDVEPLSDIYDSADIITVSQLLPESLRNG